MGEKTGVLREEFGASDNILRELAVQDPDGYMNVLQMNITKFEELLAFLLQSF